MPTPDSWHREAAAILRREQRRGDPTLARMAWTEAQVDAYADAAARLCRCEGTCSCGWDDPDSLAMQQIERMAE